jgi:hypothetical protein
MKQIGDWIGMLNSFTLCDVVEVVNFEEYYEGKLANCNVYG